MTELTQEQLAEIRSTLDLIEADNNSPVIHINDATINWMVEKFRDALNHIDAQAAQIAALEGKVALAKRGLEAVADLINDSDGCAGLHQNGDVAPWMELLTGGRFEEWLIHFDEAHRRLVVEDEA